MGAKLEIELNGTTLSFPTFPIQDIELQRLFIFLMVLTIFSFIVMHLVTTSQPRIRSRNVHEENSNKKGALRVKLRNIELFSFNFFRWIPYVCHYYKRSLFKHAWFHNLKPWLCTVFSLLRHMGFGLMKWKNPQYCKCYLFEVTGCTIRFIIKWNCVAQTCFWQILQNDASYELRYLKIPSEASMQEIV